MKAVRFLVAVFAVGVCSGCAYHGAVYSEYSQFALDVRSTAESSAPIKVALGYDRGVAAYVPKLAGNSGEACSIISWQDIGSVVSPSLTSTSKVLRADAGFISGTAATVAAAPAEAQVVIVPDAETRGHRLEFKTIGGPGARISAALAPTTFGQDINSAKIRGWLQADPANKQKLRRWLEEHQLDQSGITNILDGKPFAKTRQEIVDHFKID